MAQDSLSPSGRAKDKGTAHMIDTAAESGLNIFIYDTKHQCYAYDNRGWIPDT